MAARQFNLVARQKFKPFLTMTDLRLLVDMDFWESPCPEFAQQMAIAWLLSICCGARPGSLAESRDRDGRFLSWGDIDIQRDTGRSSFICFVTFRWWKGFNDEFRDR